MQEMSAVKRGGWPTGVRLLPHTPPPPCVCVCPIDRKTTRCDTTRPANRAMRFQLTETKTGQLQGRTGPPGCLALARWAGWSGVQVGRHVKYWSRSIDSARQQGNVKDGEEWGTKSQRGGQGRREWNGGRGQGPLAKEGWLERNFGWYSA